MTDRAENPCAQAVYGLPTVPTNPPRRTPHTITTIQNAAGLSAGDLLDVRIAVAIVDGATGTAVIGRINSVGVIPTVKV